MDVAPLRRVEGEPGVDALGAGARVHEEAVSVLGDDGVVGVAGHHDVGAELGGARDPGDPERPGVAARIAR